ncbi:hypothetical protein [Streptomyces chartreusis]|uniref:hypothetical protein n=1 Tax=Streptomyces chartreusis TaxID=1969 RepID=UPI0037F5ACAE
MKRLAAELGHRLGLHAQRLCRGQPRAIALASSIPFAGAGSPSRLDSTDAAAAVAERALVHGFALVLAPPVKSGAPELLPLCPYGGFGYESAELLCVLRRFVPHEFLDPALRTGRPASDYPRSS